MLEILDTHFLSQKVTKPTSTIIRLGESCVKETCRKPWVWNRDFPVIERKTVVETFCVGEVAESDREEQRAEAQDENTNI